MNKLMLYFACGLFYISTLAIESTSPSKDTSMIIDELYKHINGFSISEQERTQVRQKGGNPTYGEITYKGAAELFKKLNLTNNDVLVDLGSGVGKLVVQVALDT